MAYSNPTHLYYPDPTTIPTFSPFYSSSIPSTYPTIIPNLIPTPTPNPSFPSYSHHLPSYHPPPSFAHQPYSSYPNSTASPSPNHYTSYTTFSTSAYGHSTHYNYPQQQPPHSYSQPASPNAEIVQRSCNEILEFIEEFRNEMKESFQDIKESFQDIQESFQEVSESLKSRAKDIQNVFSTLRQDLQEKIEKEKVEEHTAEEPKRFVEGGDLQIIQEHQEKKEQASEPHRDFQSTSLCLELLPPPFLPTLSSQVPIPKSPKSNTFTVACKLTVAHPSPLKLPPPKPPDKVLPLFSSPSSNLQPNTSDKVLAPPSASPPPKPPDLQLQFSPVVVHSLHLPPEPPPSSKPPFTIPLLRPPPKPKYPSTPVLQPISPAVVLFTFEFLLLKCTRTNHSQPMDQCEIILGKSHLSTQSTIRALFQRRITSCHVALFTTHARQVSATSTWINSPWIQPAHLRKSPSKIHEEVYGYLNSINTFLLGRAYSSDP